MEVFFYVEIRYEELYRIDKFIYFVSIIIIEGGIKEDIVDWVRLGYLEIWIIFGGLFSIILVLN